MDVQKIEEKLKKLQGLRPLTEAEEEKRNQDFTLDFTYNSTALEGNDLTKEEMAQVLAGENLEGKAPEALVEVAANREAWDFVREEAKAGTPLTESLIRQIHNLVLADKDYAKGQYRMVPTCVYGADHQPAQPYLIVPKMEAMLEDYAKSEEHLLRKLAKLHLEFESIQPFFYGNGRANRLLTNFELIKAGYPPILFQEADREEYLQAFADYHATGETAGMEALLGRYVDQALDQRLAVLA